MACARSEHHPEADASLETKADKLKRQLVSTATVSKHLQPIDSAEPVWSDWQIHDMSGAQTFLMTLCRYWAKLFWSRMCSTPSDECLRNNRWSLVWRLPQANRRQGSFKIVPRLLFFKWLLRFFSFPILLLLNMASLLPYLALRLQPPAWFYLPAPTDVLLNLYIMGLKLPRNAKQLNFTHAVKTVINRS